MAGRAAAELFAMAMSSAWVRARPRTSPCWRSATREGGLKIVASLRRTPPQSWRRKSAFPNFDRPTFRRLTLISTAPTRLILTSTDQRRSGALLARRSWRRSSKKMALSATPAAGAGARQISAAGGSDFICAGRWSRGRCCLGASVKWRTRADGSVYLTDKWQSDSRLRFGKDCGPGGAGACMSNVPGIVEHGLFIGLASVALVGRGDFGRGSPVDGRQSRAIFGLLTRHGCNSPRARGVSDTQAIGGSPPRTSSRRT